MFRHRFLLALHKNPASDSGFTILELLITLVILAILGATAMPIWANQTQKARTAEAKTNLAVIDRAQSAHYMEYGRFAHSLQKLEVKITPKAFQYSMMPTPSGMVKHRATNAPGQPPLLKEYVSGVLVHNQRFDHVICESKHGQNHPNFLAPDIATNQATPMLCLNSQPLE